MIRLTAGQIKAQVSAIRKKTRKEGCAFAIRTSGGWSGPERLPIDGVEHLIFPCASDLQMREALHRAAHEHMPSVLLCSVDAEKLGEDVISRLAKGRVFNPKPGEMLTELFSARVIDPRVVSSKALTEALLYRMPAEGYKPVAGGTLDIQQAWAALLEQIFGPSPEPLDLAQMLTWSRNPASDAGSVRTAPAPRSVRNSSSAASGTGRA